MNEKETVYPQNRELWPDLLRIFAAFCIVLLHVASAGYFNFAPASSEWQACNLYECSTRFAVPVFVMISGAFLLNPLHNSSTKSLLAKILRLFVAYLFWSIFYSSITLLTAGQPLTINSLAHKIIFTPHYHLWFLPMLISLYFYLPILRLIAAKKSVLYYFLILAFTLFFLPKILFSLPPIAKESRIIIERFNFYLIAGYTSYFLLGYFLYDCKIKPNYRKLIYAIGLLSYFITMAITCFIGLKQNKTSENFLGFLLPNTLVIAMAIFVFFKKLFAEVSISPRIHGCISKLSKLTFGIYLLHPLFLDNLKIGGFQIFWCHPFISIPLTALAVFLASTILSAILNQIPIINKFLI